jgi:hypothetical protein
VRDIMKIIRRPINDSGKNENGDNWSVSLEMPFFEDNELDGFYSEMAERIKARAMHEGCSAFAYLCVVCLDDESFSLYVDIIFCQKRDITDFYRICDNRRNGVMIPMPKKLKRRGYDCFCFKNSGILAFKNHFKKYAATVKRKDYRIFIEAAEL